MAKPNKGGKPEPKKENWKDAHIKANAVKRAARHQRRMDKQEACPKRGLRRAVRRWCDGVSRDAAAVLRKHKNLASLVRSKPKHRRKQEESLRVSVNGVGMRSLAELAWTARQLELERATRLKGTARAS